jgi:hypothetical protein
MGGRETGRPGDDLATAAEGIAAVRAPSDPSSTPPASSSSQDSHDASSVWAGLAYIWSRAPPCRHR